MLDLPNPYDLGHGCAIEVVGELATVPPLTALAFAAPQSIETAVREAVAAVILTSLRPSVATPC